MMTMCMMLGSIELVRNTYNHDAFAVWSAVVPSIIALPEQAGHIKNFWAMLTI